MKRSVLRRRIGPVLAMMIAASVLAPADAEAAGFFRHLGRSLFDCPGPGCPADIARHAKDADKAAQKAAEDAARAVEDAAKDIKRAARMVLAPKS